jgi:hypothetical protein
MKPSSHSAADEAGSRTDRWQEAGSRRESMRVDIGGTAAIEKDSRVAAMPRTHRRFCVPGLLLLMAGGR